MTSSLPSSRSRAILVLAWIAIKVALFVLLGRTESARFVYAGF